MTFQYLPLETPPAIRVDHAVLRYPTGPFLRGSIKSNFFDLLGLHLNHSPVNQAYITALNDVSFGIQSGERLGIIGRNGAGKSSLLRAMAGIYPLEAGTVRISGRIQTLFNIDLGFELESTGRENILYRGLAMGVAPALISHRQNEIIEFAGLGRFIDFPMRTYSSGMTVRLAFSIASYLDGNVLLIDEIFGAGDAEFQAKAINRMEALIHGAEIVVFVSHDLHTMRHFCTRLIWLENGSIRLDGEPSLVASSYLDALQPT